MGSGSMLTKLYINFIFPLSTQIISLYLPSLGVADRPRAGLCTYHNFSSGIEKVQNVITGCHMQLPEILRFHFFFFEKASF